jgi:tetratricopeptide (TPR) repeat protein
LNLQKNVESNFDLALQKCNKCRFSVVECCCHIPEVLKIVIPTIPHIWMEIVLTILKEIKCKENSENKTSGKDENKDDLEEAHKYCARILETLAPLNAHDLVSFSTIDFERKESLLQLKLKTLESVAFLHLSGANSTKEIEEQLFAYFVTEKSVGDKAKMSRGEHYYTQITKNPKHKDNPMFYFYAGLFYQTLGDFEKALRILNFAVN